MNHVAIFKHKFLSDLPRVIALINFEQSLVGLFGSLCGMKIAVTLKINLRSKLHLNLAIFIILNLISENIDTKFIKKLKP
jgi:hypothetical protein